MKNLDWISFTDKVPNPKNRLIPQQGMITIFRKRLSYIEDMFEGLMLIPRKRVIDELKHFNFIFVSEDDRCRLLKYGGSTREFLGLSVRRFAGLTRCGDCTYNDKNGVVAAECINPGIPYEIETIIRLRGDILKEYCIYHQFVPFWVVNCVRYSERQLEEYNIVNRSENFCEECYCYVLIFGCNSGNGSRPQMQSFSKFHGKSRLDWVNV